MICVSVILPGRWISATGLARSGFVPDFSAELDPDPIGFGRVASLAIIELERSKERNISKNILFFSQNLALKLCYVKNENWSK